jgi:peptidoglycan/xylan/chitin deacetylase (PgdA/CDA1 family)
MRVRGTAAGLITTLVLVSACSGPATPSAAPTASASTAPPPSAAPVATAGPAPSPTTPPAPTGPPPPAGTVDRYIYDLPRFGPAPFPLVISLPPATGPAQQLNQIPVGDQRVAFITIDDGWTKDPDILKIMRAARIPFTMFLTTNAIKSDPAFFASLVQAGGVIEDHTVSHPQLIHLTYEQQRREICDNRDTLTTLFGRTPTIMRAPYGLANADTLAAAGSCGIRVNVFWNEYAVTGPVEYQRPGGIHPGDMVLMHFDQYLKANLMSTLQAFQRDGITPALLEDYLGQTLLVPTNMPPEPIV